MNLLFSPDALPIDSGTYVLWIRLQKAKKLTFSSLGSAVFLPGFYSYTGRDSRRLRARLSRHLKTQKNCHWHVDWLLTREASVVQIWVYANHPEWECRVNQLLEKLPGASIPLPGFGSSDCTSGCRAHLIQHPVLVKPGLLSLQPDWILIPEKSTKVLVTGFSIS